MKKRKIINLAMEQKTEDKTETLVLEFPIEKEQMTSARLQGETGPVQITHLYPRIKDLPLDKFNYSSTHINPRSHNDDILKSNLLRDIRHHFVTSPERYVFNNRGMTVLVDDFKYDETSKMATLIIKNLQRSGLVDGASNAYLLQKIKEEVEIEKAKDKETGETDENPKEKAIDRAQIHLEIVHGIHDREMVSSFSLARNTSRALKNYSLETFKGSLDFLRDILERDGGPFKGKISYDEYGNQDVSILDILAYLNLFNPTYDKPTSTGENLSPVNSYSGKAKLVDKIENEEYFKGLKGLAHLTENILDLHEIIYQEFPVKYNTAFLGKAKLGRRVGIESLDDDKPLTLPLTGRKATYKISSSFLLPILASFRALLVWENGKARWAKDPKEIWSKYGATLVRAITDHANRIGSPTLLGKSKEVYESLYKDMKILLYEAK